jgi:serpin B
MIARSALALPFLALAALAGCGTAFSDEVQTPKFDEARSSLSRATAAAPADAEEATFIEDNTTFAVNLLHQTAKPGANSLVSPHSISTALAMTYAGAANATKTEMQNALHFTLPDEKLHPAFNWLDQQIASRAAGARGKDGAAARVNIENTLFGAKDATFVPAFLDTLATNYGAGVKLADFASDPAGVTDKINAWIAEQTEQRIPKLLAAPLGTDTRFVLVNTVYVNAAWETPFQKSATTQDSFTTAGGPVTVPTLHNGYGEFSYAKTDAAEVVSIPLAANGLTFDVILPTASLATYEAALDGKALRALLASAKSNPVDLALPKFKIDPAESTSLKDALSALGMPGAFEGGADFTGMVQGEPIQLADVVHKAFLAIDEDGLEAAAATAVEGMNTSAIAGELVHVKVDRPFLIALRDRPTGQVLFLGHVVDPR